MISVTLAVSFKLYAVLLQDDTCGTAGTEGPRAHGYSEDFSQKPRHGLKPEREEVLARLSCTDYLMCKKLV